jgi:hypothetical protein
MTPNPKQCDHCHAELQQFYRLELVGYEAKSKEKVMEGKIRCTKCGEYSTRMQVFGGAK